MKTITLNNKFWLLILLLPLYIAGCSKKGDETPQPEPEEEILDTAKKAGTNWVPARAVLVKDTTFTYQQAIPDANGVYVSTNTETRTGKGYVYLDEKYNVVYVVDWPIAENPFYFNFDKRRPVTGAEVAEGVDWHIKNYEIYWAYMESNYNSQTDKGKIRIVRTPFDELDEAPETPMVRMGLEVEMTDYPTIDGWGWYRLGEHILHPYTDRTIILKLQDDRFVKYQFVNMYIGNPPVVKDKLEYAIPFFNFRYYIQQTPNNRNIKTR